MKMISYRYVEALQLICTIPESGFVKHKASKEVITMDTIKKVGYLIVVGLIIMLILAATGGNNIPMDMSFGIGALIALIGIGITIWEAKTNKPMFYSYGKNWFGGYLNNGAFILGVATGFFATKTMYGITALGTLAVVYAVIWTVFKAKNAEAK